MESVCSVRNLSKSFIGVRALQHIDLEIRAGEIHCLAGENGCGKSTLVKCISGVYTPDEGEIQLNGHSYRSLTPVEAMNEGVQVIYQDLSLFQHMTVAENIAIGRLKTEKQKFVSWKEIHQIAQEQLDRIGVHMNLDAEVGEISMAERQMVAICRALAQNARILFMDEPTTALSKIEVKHLMAVMNELKKKGLAVIFISHKLDEVFEVADSISIFRNGEKVGDFRNTDLDEKSLAKYMTGRDVMYQKYHRTFRDDTPLLELDSLSRDGQYERVSFQVRRGDIIGLTGLLGSGRTELAMTLFGLNPSDAGSIRIDGKEVHIKSPIEAKEQGIALLPEDRFTEGLFEERTIRENISSGVIGKISRRGILNRKKEAQLAIDSIRNLKVRTPSAETIVGTLSGGNQQKVVIAKWTAMSPRIFIMDSPTVGIDIGSKEEIYEQVQHFADEGMAILFISDEIPEIMTNCNRVIVMSHGRCVRLFEEEELQKPETEKVISDMIGAQVQEELQKETKESTANE